MEQTVPARQGSPPKAAHSGKRRVFLIDDHTLFREGLTKLLAEESDLTVCGEAGNAREASQNLKAAKPDLILIDVSLPGIDGLELIKTLRAEQGAICMLALSMHPEELYAERVIRAGASGYIMKQASSRELLSAIRLVLNGEIYLSATASTRLLRSIAGSKWKDKGLEILSDRELEIFRLTGQGFTTREMAESLHISVKTVEAHRGNMRKKLTLKTGAELTRFALAHRDG